MANVTRLFQNRRDADEQRVRSVPEPPEKCGVAGCDNPVRVLFAIARSGGRERCGGAAEFLDDQRREKSGVEFVEWIARCATCYQRDLDRTRSSRDDYLRSLPAPRA